MIKVVANMVRITLIVVICFLQGCVSQGNDIIVKSCPDFILDRITFRNCRSEILFYDLRKPDCKKTCDVAALLGKNACCSNAPWQDAALYQVAKETISRMCLRSKQLADTNHNPQPSTMCIEIIGQEYVTDGKDDRPTDYYALRLGVKVFKSGVRFRERCYTSTASARRYTCWGTASFCPLRINDLYALFSEALTKALSEHKTEWTRNDH